LRVECMVPVLVAFADPRTDNASCIAFDPTSQTGPGSQGNGFGQRVSEETQTFHPLGQVASTLAPCKP
jgi:hypothetical protein